MFIFFAFRKPRKAIFFNKARSTNAVQQEVFNIALLTTFVSVAQGELHWWLKLKGLLKKLLC